MPTPIKVTLELDDKGYVQRIQAATSETQKFAKENETAFAKIGPQVDMAVGKLKGLAAAYVGLQAIMGALKLGDELSDLSKATDISIQKILALKGALQSAGGSGEDAGRMISQLVNTLDSARQGGSDAQDQLLRLGLSFKEMANLSPEQALDKVISRLASMKDPIERNALAFQLLGKSARNIDWAEVSQQVGKAAGKYDQAAIAAQKAGDTFDRFEASTKALQVSLMIALDPLIEMIGYFDKLAGGGEGSFALKAFKTTFETVAILAATIGMVVKNIVLDVAAMVQMGKQALSGDLSGAYETFKKRNAEAQKDLDNLAQLEDRIFKGSSGAGNGKRMGATADERSTLYKRPEATGDKSIKNGLAAEFTAIQNIADAYKRANEKAREKIKLDYDLIGSSEEYKKVTEEAARIATAAQDEILKLEDKRKNLTDKQKRFGVGAEIDATIKKIKEQAAADTLANVQAIQNGEERIRAINAIKQAYDALIESSVAGTEQFQQGQEKLKDLEIARAQDRMPALAKSLDSVRVAEEKIAQARIKAEAAKSVYYQNAEGDQTPEQARALANAIGQITTQRDKNIKAQQASIQSTYDEQTSFSYGWDKAFQRYVESSQNAAQQAQSYFETFTKGFEDAMVRFVQTGKLSFKDLANTIIAQFVRIQASQMATGLGGFFSSLFGIGVGSPGSGSFVGPLPENMIPGLKLAGGGITMGPTRALIGEAGPEAVIPLNSQSMAAAGLGGTTNITYSIQAVDASSFRALVARDPSFIYAVTEKGRRSQPTRRLA